ncbi:MAG: sodium:solute symporter [Chthoniobacteraceae bacterium]
MHLIDWLLICLPILIAFSVGLYTHRYVKSVADFMSGGRMAGRYILAVASGEMQAGAVVFVALFEIFSHAGFTMSWWGPLSSPALLLVAIFGFVTYRFRETRALTLAQFFEIRYSKKFRLFTGGLGFMAGILNFGVIPSIGARFLVYFMGLPPALHLYSVTIPTYIPLMVLLLSFTVLLAVSGGIVTIMVTNCIEGILSQLFYLAIIAGLLLIFKWDQVSSVLMDRPPGNSFLNPFDCADTSDFNIWFVLMGIFAGVYGTMAWQNAGGYNSAALTPHEGRMGGLLGRCREMGKGAVVMLLAVCAVTFMQHPDFATSSQVAHETVGGIANAHLRQQMEMPIAISYMLPMGIKGLFCAILLMGVFGGDATHLHSWGGIFVQDILVPLRKKPFSPRQHIWVLRAAILGVAGFAFLFGCLFPQTEYVVMWFSITMAIYIGGAGAAIIGGLYWRKGTTAGAWAALITGSVLTTGGIVLRQWSGNQFPLNCVQISFFSSLIAISVYVVVSLLTCKTDFNLDQMLHRGRYAVEDDIPKSARTKVTLLQKVMGIDDRYTRGDKWIAGGLLTWSLSWFCIIVVGTIWNMISPWPISTWSSYWHITSISLPIVISLVTAIWFTWGGVRDIRALFRHLRNERVCHADDGTVVKPENLLEPVGIEEPSVSDRK